MSARKKRVAVYYRVSTDRQDLSSQRGSVERWLMPMLNQVKVTEFKDEGFSGKNTKRPEFQKMMKKIAQEEFEMLVVYALDRVSRSTYDAIDFLRILETHKVDFASIKQPHLNTVGMTVPFRKTIFTMFAELAELEREMISKRTKDGIAAYREKNGGTWGRKNKGTPDQLNAIKTLRECKLPYAEIARQVGLSVPKVFYYCKGQGIS